MEQVDFRAGLGICLQNGHYFTASLNRVNSSCVSLLMNQIWPTRGHLSTLWQESGVVYLDKESRQIFRWVDFLKKKDGVIT